MQKRVMQHFASLGRAATLWMRNSSSLCRFSYHSSTSRVYASFTNPFAVETRRFLATQNKKKRDYYEVLGLSKNCTENEIEAAYRKMALNHHLKKNADNKKEVEEAFKELYDAYEVLSDADERAQYDQRSMEGNDSPEGSQSSPFGGGFKSHSRSIDKAEKLYPGAAEFIEVDFVTNKQGQTVQQTLRRKRQADGSFENSVDERVISD